MAPKLSILIPNYNYGHFISETIASVILSAGSHRHDIEIIIQDGNSSDNSFLVVKQIQAIYNDVKIIWNQETDTSQAEAMGRALAKATGDYILWLNSDECVEPLALQHFLEIESDDSCDVYYGDTTHIDKSGQSLKIQARPYLAKKFIRAGIVAISSCSTFIKRETIINYKFNTEMRMAPDLDLFSWLSRDSTKWKHIKLKVGVFRWHESQITNESNNLVAHELMVLESKYAIPWGRANLINRIMYKVFCFYRILQIR